MTTIRIVLFAILLLGMIGSGVELMLLSHTEDCDSGFRSF